MQNVAQTILDQISTHTAMAIGMRDLISEPNGLLMRVGSSRRLLKLSVKLNQSDLYDITFTHIKPRFKLEITTLAKHKNVPVENLNEVIASTVNQW